MFTLGSVTLRTATGISNVQHIGFTAVFDINGDGYSDIIGTGSYYPPESYPPVARPGFVLLGSPSGFMAAAADQFPASTMLDVHAREIAFADFNEDGVTDFYIADHGYDAPPFPGQQNRLYLSTGPSSWKDATSSLPQISDFTHSVTVGDINGDGHLDILAGNAGLNSDYILLGDGKGNFTQTTALLPIGAGQALATAGIGVFSSLLTDLNGDGRPELVLGTGAPHSDYQVLWNDNGSYASGVITALPPPTNFDSNWMIYDIQSMDVNFDGLPDLVLAYQADVSNGGWRLQVLINQENHQFTDETAQYLPDASVVSSGVPSAVDPAAWIQFLIPRDLNNDGRMDFVVDGKSMGGKILPDNFPVALIHQDDGTFAPITVGDLRAQGTPDFILWSANFVARGSAGSGEFNQMYFSADGSVDLNTMPVSFAPADSHWIAGTQNSDNLTGTAGVDWIKGFAGNDTIDGGGGIDTALYSGGRSTYVLTTVANGFTLADTYGIDGTDTLINVERLKFPDGGIALDIGATQSAGETVMLLGAVLPGELVFDASKQALLGAVMDLFDQGYSLQTLSGAVMRLPIWDILANGGNPGTTNVQIATYLLANVNGTAPDATTLANAVTALNTELDFASQGNFLWHLAESVANQARIDLVGLAATGLAYGA